MGGEYSVRWAGMLTPGVRTCATVDRGRLVRAVVINSLCDRVGEYEAEGPRQFQRRKVFMYFLARDH